MECNKNSFNLKGEHSILKKIRSSHFLQIVHMIHNVITPHMSAFQSLPKPLFQQVIHFSHRHNLMEFEQAKTIDYSHKHSERANDLNSPLFLHMQHPSKPV